MYDAWKKKVMPDTTRIYYIDTWFLSQNLPYYQPETLTSFTHVRVTVDLPTFCLVTIFSVESKELELEQPKKTLSSHVV